MDTDPRLIQSISCIADRGACAPPYSIECFWNKALSWKPIRRTLHQVKMGWTRFEKYPLEAKILLAWTGDDALKVGHRPHLAIYRLSLQGVSSAQMKQWLLYS